MTIADWGSETADPSGSPKSISIPPLLFIAGIVLLSLLCFVDQCLSFSYYWHCIAARTLQTPGFNAGALEG